MTDLKRQNTSSSDISKSIREKITQDLVKRQQDLERKTSYHAEQLLSGSSSTAALTSTDYNTRLVESKLFNLIVYLVIGMNSVQLGLSVDYPELSEVWSALEHMFTAFFLIEMILKLISWRKAYFHDAWNRMDCLLVFMSVLDNWLMPMIIRSGSSELGSVSVLRIMRVCRVMRVARTLKVFKELWLILNGILSSLRCILWVILLLFLTLYVCSIFCVELMGRKTDSAGAVLYAGFDDDEESLEASKAIITWNNYAYFGTIPRSMYTLFNVAILTEFTEFARPVYQKQPAMLMFFLSFVLFTTFGLLNVIIGTICENTMEAARMIEMKREERTRQMKMVLLDKIISAILALDADFSGTVSEKELEQGWSHPDVADVIEQMNLPPGFGAKEFLYLVDMDGNTEVNVEELMTNFYRMLCYDPFHANCSLHSSLNQLKTQLVQVQTAIQGLGEFKAEMRQGMQEMLQMRQTMEDLNRNVAAIVTTYAAHAYHL